jgi:ABC-2 type transport system ATP-binding protein
MIEIRNFTKRYGRTTAVDHLTVTVQPGRVTGFLGPNGAGKSTTMRAIVGLDRPTDGEVLVAGRRYAEHPAPLREVGALLDARAAHPGRTAAAHLRALAATHGMSRARVEQVLDVVGLADVAGRRVGGFSLGMAQRLGIAAALLGDPAAVILDEPANGLDPEGILWIRNLLRGLAAEGRTVFLSSHLMSEMALTAEHLVVVGKGRLIADTSVADVVSQASSDVAVLVRTPDATRFRDVLVAEGAAVASDQRGVLDVRGLRHERIGELAAKRSIVLHELTPQNASLEEAFMRLTGEAVEYHASPTVLEHAA